MSTAIAQHSAPSTTPASLHTINAQAQSHNLPLAGYTVWYRLQRVRINYTVFKQALDLAGFTVTVNPPSYRTSLRRALMEYIQTATGMSTATDEDAPERALVRPIASSQKEWLCFVVVKEDLDLARFGIDSKTEIRLLLHKKTGALICSYDESGDEHSSVKSAALEEALKPFWDKYRETLCTTDVTIPVKNLLSGWGVRLSKLGGLYFIPAQHEAKVRVLQDMIGSLGGGCELAMIPVVDAAEFKGGMAGSIHDAIMDEVKEHIRKLEELQGQEKGPRDSTIAHRLAAYRDTREKATMYADMIGIQKQQIEGLLDALNDGAEQLLG